MSLTVAKYTFSSWLRKGLGNNISHTDNLGTGTGTSVEKERTKVSFDISITTDINTRDVQKDFELIGPGDIIGINSKMIVRTEPKTWVTNFEPNYLAFIEFYEEDFIWRYTPAKASGERLRPWVALFVLKENDNQDLAEFEKDDKRLPLPVIKIKKGDSLPPPTQNWSWGHVHINDSFTSATDFERFLQSLHNPDDPNADKIISRLVCPRKLEPNTAYRAFVVPAFETGRLGGLGLSTTDTDAQQPSWDGTTDNVEFPVYYDWFFRTGDNEDFESLVKLLQPRAMDEKVGIREMDGSQPGFGMNTGTDLGQIFPVTENQTVIGLEGALKSPNTKSRPENIDTAKPFFAELQSILNFPAELIKDSNTSLDPVVCPPIYGENHALQHEIDKGAGGWLNQLNKDPRNRVPGGFGTQAIQGNQEDYMARAWKQVEKILEANKKILFTSFAMVFTSTIKNNFIAKLTPEKLLTFASLITKKVKGSPTTLHYQLQKSNIPTASVSVAFRRIIRPRGAYFKKMQKADPGFDHSTLLKKLNAREVSAAPPKQTPENIITDQGLASQLPGAKLPAWLKLLIKNRLWALVIALGILLLIAFIAGAWIICAILALAVIALYFYAGKLENEIETGIALTDPSTLRQTILNTPQRPAFHFTETDPVVSPLIGKASGTTVAQNADGTSSSVKAIHFTTASYYTPSSTSPGADSIEAANFRNAALTLSNRLVITAPVEELMPFNIDNANVKLQDALDPRITFPKQLAAIVHFSFNPEFLKNPENLVPAMAYPDFEDPMYEKLRDISSELLIPNLSLIPQNTISLLVTNPVFIESYMVGLNNEFGKELLWREYPTDERGSYFRQFWDVKGIVNNETNLSPEQLTEKYKDITPLDTWQKNSALGVHSNRKINDGEQLVLVIRGDLLKKYPGTIIYAQKAHIYKDSNGTVDLAQSPVVHEVQTDADMKSEIRFPVFKASIESDVRFLGFDLTIEDARGADQPKTETDNWGWFFIVQQIPGEPRFGMDKNYAPDDDVSTPITWDDMAWDKYDPTKKYIDTFTLPTADFVPAGQGESRSQWGKSSADMAYILYQKPVMIAVHAKEMLTGLDH